MMNSKLFKVVTHKGAKYLMSTDAVRNDVQTAATTKRLEHYRNLYALEQANEKPAAWDEALPFEKLPGPKPLPIIGNIWRFMLPKIGNFYGLDFLDIHKIMHQEYGDIAILKGLGRKPMVLLFHEKDIEMLYRNEGVWPVRDSMQSYRYYRETRKDIFKNFGLLSQQGEDWFKFRSMVNPILMQPKNVLQYVDKMNFVTDELINNIKYLSEQSKDNEMPENFDIELYKWALESIAVVTMDKQLGCLKRNSEENSEPQRLIQSVLQMFELMYKLDVLPSLWKVISTPNWKKLVVVLNFLSETNLKYVNQFLHKLENQKSDKHEATTVLEKLVELDRDVAIAMSVDMMIAAIDTTGRVLAAALYYLAKNPEKQQEFRNETIRLLKTKNAPVTNESLSNAPYLKAVIKETMRLSPIAIGNLRTTVKRLVLGGYQIPTGTDVLSANLLLCTTDKHYPRAKEFIPERWLSTTTGELSHKNTNPFLFSPYGYGPRSCIGKRLANLELETALLKIIRNFELKWPHEDMVFACAVLNGIARPLKIQIETLDY